MYDELKDKYKRIDPAVLAGVNLLTPAKNSGYVCPFCGNGNGPDGTGVSFSLLNDGYKGYCFRCGTHFDVFDLIAANFDLDPKQDFAIIMDEAHELFGDSPKITTSKPKDKQVQDFTWLIKFAIGNLDSFLKSQRGSWRGLTAETLKSFGIGYVPEWQGDHTPRVIIPTSFTHYLARYPFETADKNIKLKPHRGTKEIFGLRLALEKADSPVFALEGEIDAMSLYQCGFTAIAFSGSDISTPQKTLLKNFPRGTKFILMFDADETGKMKTPKAEKTLTECGFIVYTAFLDKKFADANAWLQVNPAELKAGLQKIYDSAVNYFANPPAKIDNPPEGVEEISEGIYSNDFIPSCPVRLIIPHEFCFRSEGISYQSKNKKTGEVTKNHVSYTPVIPTRILTKPDGSDAQVELAKFDRFTNKWRRFTVKQTEIAKATEIVNLARFEVNVTTETAKKLSAFLMNVQSFGQNPKAIPRTVVYEKTGWHGDKFIYPPSGEDFLVLDGGFNYAEKFATSGDKIEWLKLFAQAFCESVGVRYAVGLACAAPLVHVCNTRNFQGVLIAPSGSGKSAIAKLAVSIFGDPAKLHETHNATANFVDEISPRLNDLFCWVDEFQAADKKLRENFQQVTFNYAEGKTRGRLNRNAEVKRQIEFRGTRLLTAEQNVLRDSFTQGAFNRMIELQAANLISDELAVRIHKTLQKTFGHFGLGYIEFVKSHRDAIRKTYDEFLDVFSDPYNFVPAHKQQLALVYTGIAYLLQFFEYAGVMDMLNEIKPNSAALYAPLDAEYFGGILPSEGESTNVARALSIISELRHTHAKYFKIQRKDIDDPSKYYFATEEMSPALGIKYLCGDYGFYPAEFSRRLEEKGLPPAKSLMRDFAAKGLIQCGSSKAHCHQKSCNINGERAWLYYFPRQTFDEQED